MYYNGFQYQPDFNFRDAKSACQKFMNFYVIGQMADGSQVEGIVEDMDDEGVTMMVPETVEPDESGEIRQFGGYGSFGGYGGYGGYGRRRFRRFRRRRFPYHAFVFPFIFPYPFFY